MISTIVSEPLSARKCSAAQISSRCPPTATFPDQGGGPTGIRAARARSLVALAPAWCLFDAGGAVINECIGGHASVFRTATVDVRGAIVEPCHGRVPHP